ncbi:MAG: hypothetical protein ACXWUG_30995 [Polyangiales bacterium]
MQAAFAHDPSRVVRLERWQSRAFHVVACPFRVDLPLDMSGCIVSALKDTMSAGHRRMPRGLVLASDRRAGTSGGAIFVEVEPMSDDPAIAWIEGDLLVRALPSSSNPLRHEVDELVRWSGELGRGVDSFYVGFTPGEGPRSFRPARLFAALEDVVVETFEIRSSRRSIMRALP